MNFKISMLEFFLKRLVSGEVFNTITAMVKLLMDEDKTNDEKRKEVKDAVRPFVSSFAQFFLSTIIAYVVDKTKREIADAN